MLTRARHLLAKINSVMIPGINDQHLVEVNKAVKSRGAFLHNIMPLISEAEHGTYFWPDGQRGPTAHGTEGAAGCLQRRHEHDAPLPVPRRCRRPARRDRSAEFTLEKLMGKDRDRIRPGSPRLSGTGRGTRQVQGAREGKWPTAASVGSDQDPDRRGDQRAAAASTSIRSRDGIPDLRSLDRRCEVRRSPPRRSVLPGRLRRGRRLDTIITRSNDCHGGVRRQDRRLPEERSAGRRHRPVDAYAFEYIESRRWRTSRITSPARERRTRHTARGDAQITSGCGGRMHPPGLAGLCCTEPLATCGEGPERKETHQASPV